MLLFARHGSTILNPGDPEDPRPFHRGWAEEILSELGHQSSCQMAEWLKKHPVDFIISSPLQRARQTADILQERTGIILLKLDVRLTTWNVGIFSGQLVTPETQALLDIYQHQLPDAKIPNGEPYNVFIQRLTPGLKDWLEKSKKHDILVITHHRPILVTPHILWGKPDKREGPPDPGGIVRVDAEEKKLEKVWEAPAEQEALHGTTGK
jgi:broad specificity phosphatase PhoE